METITYLNQLRDPKLKNLTNEEIIKMYQETKADECITEMFCKNYGLWKLVLDKFKTILQTDKESYLLQKMADIMNSYDFREGNKFSTYASRVIYLQLTWYRKYLSRKSRDAEFIYLEDMKYANESTADNYSFECDAESAIDFFGGTLDAPNPNIQILEVKSVIGNMGLKPKELDLCNAILDNPSITQKELAEMFGLCRITVANRTKSIQSKMSREELLYG